MALIEHFNAFWAQMPYNPISANALALHYALTYYFNHPRWQWRSNEIPVSNDALRTMAGGLTEKQFRSARAELVTAGIITFKAGKKNAAPIYSFINLGNCSDETGQSSESNQSKTGQQSVENRAAIREETGRNSDVIWTETGRATAEKGQPSIERDRDIERDREGDIYSPPISPQGETKPKRRNAKAELKTENEAAARIVQLYNSTCTSLPKCTKLTPERRAKVKTRLKTFGETRIAEALIKAEQSDFLKGLRGGWGGANFDWLFKNDSNMLKILEGNYDNDKQQRAAPQTDAMFTPTQGISDIEAAFMAQWD